MPSTKAAARRTPNNKPTIGFLGATTPEIWGEFVKAFERRLRQRGWKDGRNIDIAYRWAKGQPDWYGKLADGFAAAGVTIPGSMRRRATVIG